MDKENQHFLDKPGNLKRLFAVFLAVCAGLVLFDFVHTRHVIHEWEGLWGFYALFGFVACVILVLAAKEMRKAVMRKEDHYDDL